MDDNTQPNEVYTSTNNMEDEGDYIFDNEANDNQQWGDNLLPHKLMNIARKMNYALVGNDYDLISLELNFETSRNHVVIK